ncbi:MAG: Mur ligase family protein, partial [Alphaproteobacteria bacterium]|nr:Mur ligase family protein [Alphaproteobacteria bacterium]
MTQTHNIRALTLFADQPVFVVGLGASGLAAARGLRAGQADVLCWDDNEATRDAAVNEGFVIDNPTTSTRLKDAAALVLAPGIPLTHPTPHPAVLAAQAAGIEILGDIELLFRAEPKARYVGITGTNGKSTTTALVGHILRQGGMDVAIGGNLGIPALTLPEAAIYVLEMSSYQLDLTPSAMFDIAVLLNITPDHLDR